MTLYDLATRYIGIKELSVQGQDHPFIQWCFTLCGYGPATPDEVPWCSAFLQHPAWELRCPRSKSAAARSWLTVGIPTLLADAEVGWDVVILKRGPDPQPDASVIAAPGHVGLYAGREGDEVLVLGGNQGNTVSLARFPVASILGIRRLQS